MLKKIPYSKLNSRQQENYNFHKVAAQLADYGFNCLRLTDDWQGADFIACHADGETYLKVQLKGRLVIDRKYQGKNIHIAFIHRENVFLYDHDSLVRHIQDTRFTTLDSSSWQTTGLFSWPRPPRWALEFLEKYKI